MFDSDPRFVAGAFGDNNDRSLATIKGPFWVRSTEEKIVTVPEQLAGDPKERKYAPTRRAVLPKLCEEKPK